MALTGEAKREYQRKWMRERRDAWIESKGGRCFICGSDEQLEVDHIDKSIKAMQPAAIWSRNAAVREQELAKCQVLCQDCHKAKTRKDFEPSHGTHSRYSARGCRCELCRKAHRELAKQTRAAGKAW